MTPSMTVSLTERQRDTEFGHEKGSVGFGSVPLDKNESKNSSEIRIK